MVRNNDKTQNTPVSPSSQAQLHSSIPILPLLFCTNSASNMTHFFFFSETKHQLGEKQSQIHHYSSIKSFRFKESTFEQLRAETALTQSSCLKAMTYSFALLHLLVILHFSVHAVISKFIIFSFYCSKILSNFCENNSLDS